MRIQLVTVGFRKGCVVFTVDLFFMHLWAVMSVDPWGELSGCILWQVRNLQWDTIAVGRLGIA